MLAEVEKFVLRRADFSLDDLQEAVQDTFRSFLERNCSTTRVREAEPLGFDSALWSELSALRLVAMGVSESAGGDGAGLLELAVVAEQFGRFAAPVPVVETMVSARLLAEVNSERSAALLAEMLEGQITTIAIGRSSDVSGRRLVAAGAIATKVLAMVDDDLVVLSATTPPPLVANTASAPLSWWEVADGEVLASGAEARALFDRAECEWRILVAAVLSGVAASVLELGVAYAKDRIAFGVPIGTFQAVAHPLADGATAAETAKRLAYKAAWFYDHEPENLGALASMAYVHAAEAAEQCSLTAIQTQGGFGFTLESDVQLYFRRAKGWALIAGDRRAVMQRLAGEMLEQQLGSFGEKS